MFAKIMLFVTYGESDFKAEKFKESLVSTFLALVKTPVTYNFSSSHYTNLR